ncbi:MAG: BMP family ABC transporter substrate-binding protein [Clostridium sp.]|uniref:BMP family lipoprotein n=1 Tax=Clostridium sp. TaxID=1506 RepID=UPI00290AB51E|nr:BMP family ABC transporter substrate-binding protein [Clostridium sp.]MDU7336786.1 BMP family ABC transporter substrate-binding protein [Clostridium sp.]
MKKVLAILLAASMALSATACSSGSKPSSSTTPSAAPSGAETSSTAKADFKVTMVTDTGGVNDQSFNQLSWEGLQRLKTDTGAEVSYTESKQDADYATNLDKAVDDNNNLIWGVGFAMGDAIKTAATANKDVQFAIVDNDYGKETPANVTAVVFRAQEPSFLVGYVAAKTTKTNKVGFVGGIKSDVIDQFEYGYKAGVAYGAKEMNKKIEVVAQYAESFSDSAKGKAIASKMFSGGCDIVFHAAGNVGTGVIEAAKESKKFAIGVDKDQAYLAPEYVLTSALKKVDKAVEEVSKEIKEGKKTGGTTISLGVKEDAAGIPAEHKLMGEDTYKAAAALQDQIKEGKLVPPASEKDYNAFVKDMK